MCISLLCIDLLKNKYISLLCMNVLNYTKNRIIFTLYNYIFKIIIVCSEETIQRYKKLTCDMIAIIVNNLHFDMNFFYRICYAFYSMSILNLLLFEMFYHQWILTECNRC